MPEAPRGYLIDTNVLSNRGHVEGDPNLIEWLRRYAGLVRMSVVTVVEMRRDLLLMEARITALTDRKVKFGDQQRLARKRAWDDEVTSHFADRVESIDMEIAEKWAEISVRCPSLRDTDKLIAATALARGYGVATETLGDFRHAGLALMNPFDPTAWDDDLNDDPMSALLRHKP